MPRTVKRHSKLTPRRHRILAPKKGRKCIVWMPPQGGLGSFRSGCSCLETGPRRRESSPVQRPLTKARDGRGHGGSPGRRRRGNQRPPRSARQASVLRYVSRRVGGRWTIARHELVGNPSTAQEVATQRNMLPIRVGVGRCVQSKHVRRWDRAWDDWGTADGRSLKQAKLQPSDLERACGPSARAVVASTGCQPVLTRARDASGLPHRSGRGAVAAVLPPAVPPDTEVHVTTGAFGPCRASRNQRGNESRTLGGERSGGE